MTISERYELGRSDGVADGTVDYDWHQARIEEKRDELRDHVNVAAAHLSRSERAYVLGFARGYREATHGAPDGRGFAVPVAQLSRGEK